ncbi:MAG TPA: peptidylprolyl isomerase [Spirochaetia bacterium]|nr:peptidylprolyl isomerase [Spirochaetia bacterium]
MTRTASRFALLLLAVAIVSCAPATVQEKKVVQISYTGTLADGSVFSQSDKDKPLEFLVGGGRIIPALEKALVGLKVGDKKKISVKAADAYGDYDKAALQEVPKDRFPKDSTFGVGEKFVVQTPNGPYPVKIAEVKEKTVVVDFNHPLAGKDLTFDVVVVKIRDATAAELAPAAPQAGGNPAPAETGKK